jgi:hypothetical protein
VPSLSCLTPGVWLLALPCGQGCSAPSPRDSLCAALGSVYVARGVCEREVPARFPTQGNLRLVFKFVFLLNRKEE